MAVTEQPVDIVSTRNNGAGGPFVLGSHALRSSWVNSFFVPPDAKVGYPFNFYTPNPQFVGYGAVQDSHGRTTDPIGGFNLTGGSGTFLQLYIAEASPGLVVGYAAWIFSQSNVSRWHAASGGFDHRFSPENSAGIRFPAEQSEQCSGPWQWNEGISR